MREDTVRLWRSEFARGGVEVLKATVAPGPPPVKTEAALRVVAPLLEAPVADRPNWTIPRLMAEIEAREGSRSASRSCPRRCEKNFRWRRPRHTLKGRQIAAEIERVGLRLQLRKAQAEAGDIILLYGDESEALTPLSGAAWALRGADLRVPAPGQAKQVAILGSLAHVTRQLIVHRASEAQRDFIAHSSTRPPVRHQEGNKPVVLVEDNGPIHVSKLTLRAIEARKHWLRRVAPHRTRHRVVWTISRRAIWLMRRPRNPMQHDWCRTRKRHLVFIC